jgi:hypothetical protein
MLELTTAQPWNLARIYHYPVPARGIEYTSWDRPKNRGPTTASNFELGPTATRSSL